MCVYNHACVSIIMHVCECMRVCMRARACVCKCMYVCKHACVSIIMHVCESMRMSEVHRTSTPSRATVTGIRRSLTEAEVFLSEVR